MLDLTAGETKKFEQLPEDKWILARLVKREVLRWSEAERKFHASADEIIVKLMKKLATADDASDQAIVRKELSAYRFSFVFKILDNKKYAGSIIKATTGIFLNFTNTWGEDDPNQLAQLYLGAGGVRIKKGERTNVDSILGNYVAIQVESKKNQQTRKVYQRASKVRELTTDELAVAKTNEAEIDKVEKAVREAEEKALSDTMPLTQKPVLDQEPQTPGEMPF